jgi:heme/copper-type cytochrome/quinol oxidase subunit 2
MTLRVFLVGTALFVAINVVGALSIWGLGSPAHQAANENVWLAMAIGLSGMASVIGFAFLVVHLFSRRRRPVPRPAAGP